MVNTSPELLITCQLAVHPGPDCIKDFLLLRTQQFHRCRRKANIGKRDFGGLGIVVDCANCRINHIWMAQEHVFEFGGSYLESIVTDVSGRSVSD
jgi:hypothetical protein